MFKKHKFISFLIIFARMGTSTNYIELKRGLSLYIKQYYKPTTVTANTYSWGDRIRTIIGKKLSMHIRIDISSTIWRTLGCCNGL